MEEKDLIEENEQEKEKPEEYVPNEWEIKYARLQAEFENFRQRLRKEKEEWQEIANAKLLKEIVEIMDNFKLALESIKHTRKKDAIIEGVEMIYKQFENLLEKEGVIKIKTVGKIFDPNIHEAVGVEEVSNGEDNIILKEISPGYLFKNRLLRPARVIVSKKIQNKEVDNHGENSRN